MKQTTIFIVLLMFAVLSLSGQENNYSPCYNDNMSKGNTAFKEGRYNEAKTYYVKAKQCNGGNPSIAQQKINSCDEKINAQKEAAEAKRKAEEAAAEARRKTEQEAAEAKRKAEETEAKRKAEEADEEKRKAEEADAKRKAEEAAEVKQEAEKATRQKAIAEAKARGYEEFTVNGITFRMIFVEGGSFTMGCTSEQGGDCDGDEKPSHQVTLSDYWIGETEVTQALWEVVMGTTVREQRDKVKRRYKIFGEGASYPMYYVSWNEAVEFCNRLNERLRGQSLSGYKFALPTEAQWEYAARGGNKSQHYKYAGNRISVWDVAWYYDNSSSMSHPVKGKWVNELGLYDMSGNVWEWCSDWYGSYSSSSQTNPTGPSTGSYRVFRGGSWYHIARFCRVSFRNYGSPDDCGSYVGFRLVLVRE